MDAVDLLPDDTPQWQIDIVNQRMAEYKHNLIGLEDFDDAMNAIEKEL